MRKLQQRQPNDLSRSVTALDMDTTLIAVVEMSLSSWLVAGIVPGVEPPEMQEVFPLSARAVVVSGPGSEGDERDTLEDDDPICWQTGVEIAVGRDQPSRIRHTTASVSGRIAVEHLDEKAKAQRPM